MKKHLLFALLGFISTASIAQESWYQVDVPTDHQLNVVVFTSTEIGYIGGNDSLLLKTTDGGSTWNELAFTGVTFFSGGEHIINLEFVSDEIGYMAVGPYHGVFKTTDGGLTWTSFSAEPSMCYNYGLYFTTEDNGFIGGSGCFMGEMVQQFTDGTPTFASLDDFGWSAMEMIVDFDFRDTLGLAASAGGRIYRSTDSGATWDSIPSSLGSIPLTSIAIIDDTLAYAGYDDEGSASGILRSTDGGLTWTTDISSATFFYPSFLCLEEAPNGTLFSGGATPFGPPHGVILESSGADSWYTLSVDQAIRSMDSSNDNIHWGVGDSGYVVVNIPPAGLGFGNGDPLQEDHFICYPNPSTGLVNISKALEEVEVLDQTGRVILRAKNTSIIDLTDTAPGMYIVRSGSASERVMVK